jgi:DNA-binding NtrC family response regulator
MTRRRGVLLVEDDESLRTILARHLRRHGLEVSDVASAEEANDALVAGMRPALVVLDVNLPGATGWEFLRGPAFTGAGSPPVVITSATTVSPRRLAEFSCAGFLPKPFPLETLATTVERLLSTEEETENA